MTVSPIPTGYSAVTPYLVADGAAKALAFYTRAFGARELFRLASPNDRIGHAEFEIGDCRLMIADESPAMGTKGPASYGGSPITLLIYVPDTDAVIASAQAAGATVKSPAEDKFYGDRMGTVVDPFGHTWHVSTHIEDVTPEEIDRRMRALFPQA